MNTQVTSNSSNTASSSTRKVWFITGASRGLGVSIAKAALAAGDAVVATGRDAQSVERALDGSNENLLALTLDVTDEVQAQSVVQQAVEHFGRIDVLVNNAGYGLLGAVEECSAAEVEAQFRTNVFGLLAVTRAALPALRKQRSGHILNISSIGGFVGFEQASIYCASKFAVEGISESLALEVEPFGIRVTIVGPGYFRTDFLTSSSLNWAANKLDAYDKGLREQFNNHSGQQAGDPDKLAQVLLAVVASENPPLHLPVGPDAVEGVEKKLEQVRADINEWRDLACSTNIDS